jgi:uncharacterized RDD family membrane protein YckC
MSSDREQRAGARFIEASARAGDRIAHATGVSEALDQAVEEAIVRAFRSQALRRALERALNETDPHEDIDPEELAWLLRKFLRSETANVVWAEVLESDQVQLLVERIADAPEVRAAITAQGAGLLGDIGVRLTRLTEALDDAVERVVRPASYDSETNQAGLATRSVAAAVDLGLLFLLYTLASAVLSSILNSTIGGTWPFWLVATLTALGLLAGGSIIIAFWALVGQTPGMRFLAIKVVHEGSHELGLRIAIKRMMFLLFSLIPAGLGFLWIARDDSRRGWHDRWAGTEVIYVEIKAAPHSRRESASGSSRAGDTRRPRPGAETAGRRNGGTKRRAS